MLLDYTCPSYLVLNCQDIFKPGLSWVVRRLSFNWHKVNAWRCSSFEVQQILFVSIYLSFLPENLMFFRNESCVKSRLKHERVVFDHKKVVLTLSFSHVEDVNFGSWHESSRRGMLNHASEIGTRLSIELLKALNLQVV